MTTCHVWIDTETGACGWQGDLIRHDDGTYTDMSARPALTGQWGDLRFAAVGRHTHAYLFERCGPVSRKMEATSHPPLWKTEPTNGHLTPPRPAVSPEVAEAARADRDYEHGLPWPEED